VAQIAHMPQTLERFPQRRKRRGLASHLCRDK
jgi:hypothetical protein